MNAEQFDQLLAVVLDALYTVAGQDWSKPAGTLEWTCWQTVDHTVDCVFSYTMQVAARADSGFLPLGELHADPTASPEDLLRVLRAVGTMFVAVVRQAPPGMVASDGVLSLDLSDWCARAAYELSLHGHDVLSGLGAHLELPVDLCRSILTSPALWMFDRERSRSAPDPRTALLLGSGRPFR